MGGDDARVAACIGIMPRMSRAQPLQAPVGLLPLPRPLMTGEVLDAAFRLFRAGLLRCLPYSGLAVLVLELPTLYANLAVPGGAHRLRDPALTLRAAVVSVLLGVALARRDHAAAARRFARPEAALSLAK